MIFRFFIYLSIAIVCGSCFKDPPATEPPSTEIADTVLVENLQFPWELAWGPDNYLWVTERPGRVKKIDPANGNVVMTATINEVVSEGEGGLLGMELHPQFPATPYIYVAYNYNKSGEYTEKIVRYTFNNDGLENPVVLLDNIDAANIHNGCRLLISSDNKLFISTGDASDQSLPQNIGKINGKILRINLDGSIPDDNPYTGSAVWSRGHRNAQGLVFVGDSLFSSEHGPDSDDEINIIHRASNYGWPDVKGACDANEQSFCTANNVVEPIMMWTPTIAVSGMDYYNNDLIPLWKNSLLVCTLKGTSLMQLELNNSHTQIIGSTAFFNGTYGRLRDVCISPAGKVYICTSNGNNDKIIELTKK